MNKPRNYNFRMTLSAIFCFSCWGWFFLYLPVFSSPSHGPAGDFGMPWVFAVYVGVALGLIQLGCVLVALRGEWDWFRRIALAGLVGAYCFQLLWATDLFFVARLYCSSYSLSEFVNEARQSATLPATPRRVGLFAVERVKIAKDGSVYLVTEVYPECEYGIGWVPRDVDRTNSQERVFSHWYKFYNSRK
ncbi:hypothetical protein NA78x_005254 [Anatilimnocola sp. NA78]|uniref:hypothetical protein n=1 Tax=Anatilimnocola sp. NA78 TaxID=3415683 RepID=UPI003CE5BE03